MRARNRCGAHLQLQYLSSGGEQLLLCIAAHLRNLWRTRTPQEGPRP